MITVEWVMENLETLLGIAAVSVSVAIWHWLQVDTENGKTR